MATKQYFFVCLFVSDVKIKLLLHQNVGAETFPGHFSKAFQTAQCTTQKYKEGLKAREWYVHFAKAEGQARVDKFLIYFKQLTYNYMYWM